MPERVSDLVYPARSSELLVLGGPRVRRLDSSGVTLRTYEFPGRMTLQPALDASGDTLWVVTRYQVPFHFLGSTGLPFRHALQRIDLATGAVLLRRALPDAFVRDLTVVDGERLRAR